MTRITILHKYMHTLRVLAEQSKVITVSTMDVMNMTQCIDYTEFHSLKPWIFLKKFETTEHITRVIFFFIILKCCKYKFFDRTVCKKKKKSYITPHEKQQQ